MTKSYDVKYARRIKKNIALICIIIAAIAILALTIVRIYSVFKGC